MKKGRTQIFVYADWQPLDEPTLLGVLKGERIRGNEVFSFEYDLKWLDTSEAQLLDPDLQFYSGQQYLNDPSKANFGLFLDSSPDRWGRLLMRRKETALAKSEDRREANLFETDYLLGVFDTYRMGGLRFKLDKDGDFLDNSPGLATPPVTSIRELEEISLKLESNDAHKDPQYINWLNMLLSPGSSLGGARPKASVIDEKRQLWIAKFPSIHDESDIGAWEMVTGELARKAGIDVPVTEARRFSGRHHTFLSKRFDRGSNGKRIHFASALTLLGYTDGQDYSDGVSYLEIAEFISRYGAEPERSLKQLWKRIVFSILVSNTDDHLRNHGFLLTQKGWVLSPAFDINPVETGHGLKLNISETDNSLDLSLALSVCKNFSLNTTEAQQLAEQIERVTIRWENVAKRYNISSQDRELKSRAFKNY